MPGLVFEKDHREKNWGFFASGGELFAVYWVAPHVVFRCDLQRRRLGQRWETPWTPPDGVGLPHGGSTPVWHEGMFWRVVHSYPDHQGGKRRYRLWLMAFADAPPFAPRLFCAKPLVVAEPEREPIPEPIHHDVVFCSSIERTDGGWRLFFGDNDRRMRQGVIEDALIAPHLVRVTDSAPASVPTHAMARRNGRFEALPGNIGPCDIAVISLPEREDRRSRIREIFAGEQLPFRFVDGVRVTDAEIRPEEVSGVGWDGKDGIDRPLYLRALVGCKRAHVLCLEEAARHDVHSLLIFEDDAAFRDHWREVLQRAVSELPAGWLQLYLSGSPFRPTVRVSEHLLRSNGLWLTTAILYSKAGIREALASARRARCEIDHWLGIDLHPRGHSYLVDPAVTYQVSGFSDCRGTWRGELG